tara:strand:+ start:234 stop:362 length:129 start_codon:yes stop_codon:yes gene_type:complete
MTEQYEYYDPDLPINQTPPNSEEDQLGGYWRNADSGGNDEDE